MRLIFAVIIYLLLYSKLINIGSIWCCCYLLLWENVTCTVYSILRHEHKHFMYALSKSSSLNVSYQCQCSHSVHKIHWFFLFAIDLQITMFTVEFWRFHLYIDLFKNRKYRQSYRTLIFVIYCNRFARRIMKTIREANKYTIRVLCARNVLSWV